MSELIQLVNILPQPPPIPPTFLNGFMQFTKMTNSETKSAKFAEKQALCITALLMVLGHLMING